ncbi:hypothetical protein QTP88_019979 [Uroleucon formosanum]
MLIRKQGEIINGKWQNIREAFVKSLKKKSGQYTSKKYLYHDHLTFLLKVVQSDDTESSIDDTQHDKYSLLNEDHDIRESESNIEIQSQQNVSVVQNDKRNFPKKARLQERQEDIDRQILKALENPPDEDEAFFISITLSVRKMSDEDKLDFQMNVLQLIKDINRRANNHPPSTITSRSTSSSSTPYLCQPSTFSNSYHNDQQTNLILDSQHQFTQQTYHLDESQPPLTQTSFLNSKINSPGPSTLYSP